MYPKFEDIYDDKKICTLEQIKYSELFFIGRKYLDRSEYRVDTCFCKFSFRKNFKFIEKL